MLAVYDAFLAIVARRTADLIRIATNGTGRLPEGALHPDLVNRLTEETCTAAHHVLEICIRALDYCPSVDITFGEYLRALITADFDVRPEDPLGYRIAFMEAFQKRGIPVRDVRTISTESLVWNAPMDDQPAWLKTVFERFEIPFGRRLTRSRDLRAQREEPLAGLGGAQVRVRQEPGALRPSGVEAGRPALRLRGQRVAAATRGTPPPSMSSTSAPRGGCRPDGSVRVDIVAVVTQRRPEPIVEGGKIKDGFFWFRSGSTLVLDSNLGQPRIRYNIVKGPDSARRLAMQRTMAAGGFATPLRSLYFGADRREPFALLHEGHRGTPHA